MTRYDRSFKHLITTSLILLLGSSAACSMGRGAAEAPCHNDRVQTSPGLVLPLASGQIYQVYPTDNHISMNWRPLDKLLVCPIGGGSVEITNMTEKDEKVSAQRLNFTS
jgi:hypothetical protein